MREKYRQDIALRRSFKNLALILLASGIVTASSLLLDIGVYSIQIFFDYFRHPLIFLLNWVPVLLLELFLLGVFGRQWPAFLGTALIVLLTSIGSFYKMRFRGEPFMYSDFSSVSTALGVAGDFDLTPNVRIYLAIGVLVVGTVLMGLISRQRLKWTVRLSAALLSALMAAVLWNNVYSNEEFYQERAVSEDHIEVETLAGIQFVSKGSIYPFLHSFRAGTDIAPAGYDEETVLQMISEYSDQVIPEDQKVNFLVFQLESFCDLSTMGFKNLSPESYEIYHQLETEGLSGNLITNTIGGGTINAERTFLTGSYLLPEYKKPAYSNVWYLRDQGYRAVAHHPYTGRYYSRSSVNYYLGFEEFWSMDDQYQELLSRDNTWLSDDLLFPTLLEQYSEIVQAGDSVLSFTVTTQGHGGYPTEGYEGEVYWSETNCSSEAWNAVNSYLQYIHGTQVQLQNALEWLREQEDPAVVIIYGDHKPYFSAGEHFYDDLGINMDCSTEEGFFNYYSTRYLIWANNAAKEMFQTDFIGEGKTISPCFLMTQSFDLLGWDGSKYMQFYRQVMGRIPVINTNGYYLVDGSIQSVLSAEDRELLQKMEWVQYYANTHAQ